MNMKYLKQAALSLVLFFGFIVPELFAAQPTVTVSKIRETRDVVVYSFSYSTSISAADSAIFTGTGSWLSLEGLFKKDSLMTIEIQSSETTADSVRHTILMQVSSANSPSESDWLTAYTDALSFTNTTSAVAVIRPRRYANSTKMRLVIYENDTLKDASQTISGYIIVSK